VKKSAFRNTYQLSLLISIEYSVTFIPTLKTCSFLPPIQHSIGRLAANITPPGWSQAAPSVPPGLDALVA